MLVLKNPPANAGDIRDVGSILGSGRFPGVVKVTQSCRTLCDPMDYTVHWILQARILEWAVFPISRRESKGKHFPSPGGGNGNPLQFSCLENPMDRGAWWATVHSVARSWTQLEWLSTHKCMDTVKVNTIFKNKQANKQTKKRAILSDRKKKK